MICGCYYAKSTELNKSIYLYKYKKPTNCTPICILTEKIVDHVFEHQQTIHLRTIIEVLILEVLSLNTGETKS
jgi:hypothetical protein